MTDDCESLQVSIHAPAKGATQLYSILAVDAEVSIHAPAKGATLGGGKAVSKTDVSIHAPAKGATLHRILEHSNLFGFNPRSREGSDDLSFQISDVYTIVSIHAPAKGATALSRSSDGIQ